MGPVFMLSLLSMRRWCAATFTVCLVALAGGALPATAQTETESPEQKATRARNIIKTLEPFAKMTGRFEGMFPHMSRDQRWQSVYDTLDKSIGQPGASSAKEIPAMAKAILSAPDIQPWVQAMAHFVLQDFKKTESISLKEAAETRDPIPRIGCWVLAAHAAREEGKLELALERFEKSAKLLDQAELNDPHLYLFLWIELHEGLLQIARIKQDAEGCLNAMRKLYVKVSEHDGPLSGRTLGYHNLYANELYYQRHL